MLVKLLEYFLLCLTSDLTRVLQVDAMKEAYAQDWRTEENEESAGDEIAPRDVGHNIYILAHQVGSEPLSLWLRFLCVRMDLDWPRGCALQSH